MTVFRMNISPNNFVICALKPCDGWLLSACVRVPSLKAGFPRGGGNGIMTTPRVFKYLGRKHLDICHSND